MHAMSGNQLDMEMLHGEARGRCATNNVWPSGYRPFRPTKNNLRPQEIVTRENASLALFGSQVNKRWFSLPKPGNRKGSELVEGASGSRLSNDQRNHPGLSSPESHMSSSFEGGR